jgi:Uma2 family endonuclease
MTTSLRWTIADTDALPDNGSRYEIIDGEIYVSKQPHWHHQATSANITIELGTWSRSSGLGRTFQAPGILYADDEAVVPDVAWVSKERLASVLAPDGKLYTSPDLVVEVLSAGTANEQRDRDAKRRLYSRRGVQEYWIADWRATTVEVYRRQQAELRLIQTLLAGDELTSPLLPGFACVIDRFFEI